MTTFRTLERVVTGLCFHLPTRVFSFHVRDVFGLLTSTKFAFVTTKLGVWTKNKCVEEKGETQPAGGRAS